MSGVPPIVLHGVATSDNYEDPDNIRAILIAGLGFTVGECAPGMWADWCRSYVRLGGSAYVVRETVEEIASLVDARTLG